MSQSLLPQPELEPLPGTETYRLRHNYRIYLPVVCQTLHVSKGYTTDGASIPWLFRPLIGAPFDPDLVAPALCHDALYQAELFERHVCDHILFRLLRLNGSEAWWKSCRIWLGVRAGGWAVWANHTEESIAIARDYCLVL